MDKIISIETTRFSELLKRILNLYNKNVQIRIDQKSFNEKDIEYLLNTWCTNKNIKSTVFFNLKQNDEELFGFFDHPYNFWADVSMLPFIEELANEKIIRFSILRQKKSKLIHWFKKILKLNNE